MIHMIQQLTGQTLRFFEMPNDPSIELPTVL